MSYQPQAVAGGFASCNPRLQVLAGMDALTGGDPKGVAVGIFGWANVATGRALNVRTASTDRLGFVLPPSWQGAQPANGWLYAYRDEDTGLWMIRPGLPVTLAARGDFWTRFPGGATRGVSVYANPVDGTPISGYADDAELTPWNVVTSAAPGQLAIISTWSYYPQ